MKFQGFDEIGVYNQNIMGVSKGDDFREYRIYVRGYKSFMETEIPGWLAGWEIYQKVGR